MEEIRRRGEVYSHDGPIRRRMCGYILTTDQPGSTLTSDLRRGHHVVGRHPEGVLQLSAALEPQLGHLARQLAHAREERAPLRHAHRAACVQHVEGVRRLQQLQGRGEEIRRGGGWIQGRGG
eukprot:1187255-Prorocentrum_minimum.AAC.3